MWAYLKALENWEYMCRTEASATQRAARRVKYTEINAAAVVNEICERRKISRAKLCEAIGTKTSTLQRLMSGDTKSLNLTTYNKIVAWDNSQP
jgi:DNA-binding Xre family transcriptional regulator